MSIEINIHYCKLNVPVAHLLYGFVDKNRQFLKGLNVTFTVHPKKDPLFSQLPLLLASVS